jgi:shikimate kinase
MRNIVLAGFMGTGKTTVGQIVAARTGLAFVDTDAVIVARAGRSIAEIFAAQGEPAFRALEAEVCADLAAGGGQVIATGGGALLDPRTVAAFADGNLFVCLTCDLDEIARRIGDDPLRPLARDGIERLARLLESRRPIYARVPHQIDTSSLTPQQAAEEIIRLWQHT